MIPARIIAALRRDERGMALVEFACVLPFLLLMYIGGVQLCDALSCNRKVTITARAIADLTTQSSTASTSSVSNNLNAATQILAPYNVSNALVRVTELQTDSKGNTTVAWSQDNQGGGRTQGSSYILPSAIATPSSCLIMSEVFYSYQPPVNFRIVKALTLHDVIYMNSRVSNQIPYNGTPTSTCPSN